MTGAARGPTGWNTPVRVLVADDQVLVRSGLKLLIDATPDLEVVGEAGDGTEAVRLAAELHPDLVLMDLLSPPLDGVEATAAVVRSEPAVRVLVVAASDDEDYLRAALRSGARGVLSRDTAPEELVSALRQVAGGGALLSPSATRHLIEEYVRVPTTRLTDAPELSMLTEREVEVLWQVAQGRSNHEIGEALFVTASTAKTHVRRLLMKLGARDRSQLVGIARDIGLAEQRAPG